MPAVGTSVSALPEIIIDRKTGLLSTPGDHGAMAENMLKLLTDHALRQKIISRGRDHVQTRFNNRLLIDELASIYCRNIPSLQC